MRKGQNGNKGNAHGNKPPKENASINAKRPVDNFAESDEPEQTPSFEDDFDDDSAGAAAVAVNVDVDVLNELQDANAKLAKKVEDLLEQAEKLNADNEALTTEKTTLTDQVSQHEQIAQELEQKVATLEDHLQTGSASVEALQNENTQLKEEVAEMAQQLEQRAQTEAVQQRAHQETLNTKEVRITHLEDKLREQTESAKELDDRVKELQGAVGVDVDVYERRIQSQQRQIKDQQDALRSQANKSAEEVEALDLKVADLKKQLRKVKQEHMLSSNAAEDATARVKILEQTVRGLRVKKFDEGDTGEAGSTATPPGVKYNVFEQRIEEQSRQIHRLKHQVWLSLVTLFLVCNYCPAFCVTWLMSIEQEISTTTQPFFLTSKYGLLDSIFVECIHDTVCTCVRR